MRNISGFPLNSENLGPIYSSICTLLKYSSLVLPITFISYSKFKPSATHNECVNNFFSAGCLANCEECVNGYDCSKCQPGTSKVVQGLHTSCVTSCPFGYTTHGNAKTGRVCVRKRLVEYCSSWAYKKGCSGQELSCFLFLVSNRTKGTLLSGNQIWP